jgi:hypothetical protein
MHSRRTQSYLFASRALAGLLLVFTSACAGSTIRSGVGDKHVEQPPYYAGRWVTQAPGTIGHLPISYQRGATHSPIFDVDGATGTPVAALVQEMNRYLDSLGVTTRLASAGIRRGIPPDVRFGCQSAPDGECVREPEGSRRHDIPRMRLAVARPSGGWVAETRSVLDHSGQTHALVITLEVGQYWMHQKNWRGDKEVRLGTGHSMSVPWLTSLETPVSTLQLTGVLVDRDGRAVRIGAEGLIARRTRLLLSSLDVQALISDEDVERVRGARRDDLPGRPLVWEVALRNLVAELTGRMELAVR